MQDKEDHLTCSKYFQGPPSVNHVVRMRTYLVRISKLGDIFDQKYYPIRTFAHCTYPVRMYVFVRNVSICTYLHVSIFMSLRNTYIYYHIRAIRTSKDIHTYTYIHTHIYLPIWTILTYTYIRSNTYNTYRYVHIHTIHTYTNNTYRYNHMHKKQRPYA